MKLGCSQRSSVHFECFGVSVEAEQLNSESGSGSGLDPGAPDPLRTGRSGCFYRGFIVFYTV